MRATFAGYLDLALMAEEDWGHLRGAVLSSGYLLEEIVHIDRFGCAIFRAVAVSRAIEPQQVFVTIEKFNGSETHLNRFREAASLSHANLAQVVAVGRHEFPGQSFVWIATELGAPNLLNFFTPRPPDLADVRELTNEIVSALLYIHSKNLVYCGLCAAAVWRMKGRWKLAEFRQLRAIGAREPTDTRSLLVSQVYETPPEAYDGIVSPAWDVWSLGSLLRKSFLRTSEQFLSGRSPSRKLFLRENVPSPFDVIIRDSLAPKPEDRLTLRDIVQLLSDLPAAARTPFVARP
jgi:serine/threonine protein kinase